MNQNTRKSSEQIIAELEELTKNEIKDNRPMLSDKESYELLLVAILNKVKEDIQLDPTTFNEKNLASNIEDSEQKSYLDAIKYIDDGRMDELLYKLDPFLDTENIKDEFRKRIK